MLRPDRDALDFTINNLHFVDHLKMEHVVCVICSAAGIFTGRGIQRQHCLLNILAKHLNYKLQCLSDSFDHTLANILQSFHGKIPVISVMRLASNKFITGWMLRFYVW